MGLTQSAYLLALSALAIPLLLHLFSRWQAQQIELGTIRFLREVLTESAHRRRIRRWLLLLTRMCLLALIAFLFARPFLSEATRRDGERRRIVLIDRSASMLMRSEQERLLEKAIGKANQSVDELGPDARIDWAFFDTEVVPFTPRTGRATLADASLIKVAGATSYGSALAWARDLIAADPKSKTDLILVTDLQRRGLMEIGEIGFPKDVPVRIVDVGRSAAANLAILHAEVLAFEADSPAQGNARKAKGETSPIASALSKLSGSIRPNQSVRVHVTFFNYGPVLREDVPITVTATLHGKSSRVRSTLNIHSEQAAELELDLGRLEPGTWQLVVEADLEDDLQIDNRRLCAVRVEDKPEILVIEGSKSQSFESSAAYYLMAALGQKKWDPKTRFAPELIAAEQAHSAIARQPMWPVIVLADAAQIDRHLIDPLERYVKNGGNLLAFVGRGTDETGLSDWQKSSLAPGKFNGVRLAGVVPFRLAALQRQHPMLAPFEDPQNGDLERLAFRKIVALEPTDSQQVLCSFDRNYPALIEHRVGQGKSLWFMSDASDAWGPWPNSPLYLPVVQQMASDLLGMTGEGPIRLRSVGDSRLLRPASSNRVDPRKGTSPSVTPVSISSGLQSNENKNAMDSDIPVGFDRSGFVEADNALYVVNLPERESDTARVDESEFRRSLGLEELIADEEESVSKIAIKRIEIWPWLASILLMVLVFEFALSNRTPA